MFIYSDTPLLFFLVFFMRRITAFVRNRPNTLNVKTVKLSAVLVFRHIVCQLLLMCLYNY